MSGIRRGTRSVKRPSGITLDQTATFDSAMTANPADPRFSMYNREMIKSHLDKRRRRAQSNIRPRQRFSTITAFTKNEIGVVGGHQQDITPKSN